MALTGFYHFLELYCYTGEFYGDIEKEIKREDLKGERNYRDENRRKFCRSAIWTSYAFFCDLLWVVSGKDGFPDFTLYSSAVKGE
jgi:hypothetical protein